MRLVTYERDAAWRAGLLVEGNVIDLADAATELGLTDRPAGPWLSVRAVLESVSAADLNAVHAEAVRQASGGRAVPVADVRLGPPIPDPDKIICIGLNYPKHVDEVGLKPSAFPEIFSKYRNALAGPNEHIVPPGRTAQLDYEGELAVVIGRRCKDVPQEEALDQVAGYMVFNDVSARDLQLRGSQWLPGKSCDSFAPCGPALVTADDVQDLAQSHIVTRINGDTVQKALIGDMMFSIAEIIAELSTLMTLEVGDIIATGTPHGVGMSFDPPRFLQAGDEVVVEIDGVGRLVNTVAGTGNPHGEDERR